MSQRDLSVDTKHRRRGVARAIVQRLLPVPFGKLNEAESEIAEMWTSVVYDVLTETKRKPACPCQGVIGTRVEQYDAYACLSCNSWLEAKCADPSCDFCAKRPARPFTPVDS